MDSLCLKGKTAIITGAGRLSGIGAAVSKKLAEMGADIVFTYWGEYDKKGYPGLADEPAILEKEIRKLGVRCIRKELDLSNTSSFKELFDFAESNFNFPHILINNACFSVNDDVDNITSKNLDKHYEINVRATLLLSCEFIKRFSDTNGRIVNLTSGQSLGAMIDEISYAVTKGAVETITYTLAAAAAPKCITVNAINPGPTDTGWVTKELSSQLLERFPMGRLGTPMDAAMLISFLCTENAQWITGQIIHSEGGFIR